MEEKNIRNKKNRAPNYSDNPVTNDISLRLFNDVMRQQQILAKKQPATGEVKKLYRLV